MMYADSHTHCTYSFDGQQTVDELCASALEHGLSRVAITDHFDADGEFEDYYTHYDPKAAKRDIEEAREKYRGRLEIARGLELGQPYSHPAESEAFVKKYSFDFVIGSLHNLLRVPDFSLINFEKVPQPLIERLWERDLEETYELLLDRSKHGCKINTLGHLTYPVRYIKRAGRELDMKPYIERIEQIYRRIIENGIALEVNTSGIRQGAGMTYPDESLLRLYRDTGGELLTVGSDAHFSQDVGADIPQTYKMLADIGFKAVSFIGENGTEQIDLK